MDEIYLDYDPRNALFRPPAQPGRPAFGAMFPQRYPVVRGPIAAPQPQPQPQPQPIYYPQPYYPPVAPPPASKLGSKLSDLTVGDVVPLLAQLVIAFRPMPVAPTDEGVIGTNVVNLTKFIDAIGRHFHADQQLNAAGEAARTFLR